jgi:hypothetical protein
MCRYFLALSLRHKERKLKHDADQKDHHEILDLCVLLDLILLLILQKNNYLLLHFAPIQNLNDYNLMS